MTIALPPARRRSPDHPTGHPDHPTGHPDHAPDHPTVHPPPAYVSESASGHAHGLDEPLSWDHFAVEVTENCLPVVVHCRGGLDFAYADELRNVFAGITELEVVVDLHRLTFIDSTGLSVLLSARRTLRDVGGMLWIRGASGLVRRVFEAVELADVLDD